MILMPLRFLSATLPRLCAALLCLALLLGGCGFGSLPDQLSRAVLNQVDPETVRDGAPAYLMLLDTLIEGEPDDAGMLRAGASLYGFYAVVFSDDPARSKRLTDRARDYGERALCEANSDGCGLTSRPFDEFAAILQRFDEDELPELYALTVSWLAWVRAHSDDWGALADLPKLQRALERMLELDERYQNGSLHQYLGILKTLRPPALGGRPEEGRRHFERAIEISQGKDLSAKLEYARSYARLVYDRGLHDRLLQEVVQADPRAPGLTLMNTLAQRQARQLLAEADRYF